ncbi:unnamed protein product [Parnassius apollo]|nr:unnamed protein product [Parnassius apollo]
MHTLRDETKSQSTKESLESATCKIDPPIVSSAYNKMGDTDSKLDFNKEILHAGITIETIDKNNITDKKTTAEDLSKEHVNDILIPVAKKGVKRTVLKIPPDTLPCPIEKSTTTELIPYIIDPVIPIQNEMKTFRFQEMNISSSVHSTPTIIVWSICFAFFFT